MVDKIKTLSTLPRLSRLVRVRIKSIEMDMSENYMEAYAEIEEQVPHVFPSRYDRDYVYSPYDRPTGRNGRVRLSVETINELATKPNIYYQVEESHVEWEN